MNKILVIDDDFAIQASLKLLLRENGYDTESAVNPDEALERLKNGNFDLVLLDLNYSIDTSGDEGISLLCKLKENYSFLPVVIITAWGSVELAVKGMRLGADDFLCKPWSNDELLKSVKTILSLKAQENPVHSPDRKGLDSQYDLRGIAGSDIELLKALTIAGRVSSTDAPVLILGESGTGKELIAEAIHRNSPRKDGPFVKVNMSGIPASLFESEMFGHVKGAFTGAFRDRPGRFPLADGGTIFLDEIGDVDLTNQAKLLRVLQEQTYEVLGSSRTEKVDIRIISATNRNLTEMIQSGDFREDLYYRLNLISIKIPPLRERLNDIPDLAEFFLSQLNRAYGKENLSLNEESIRWLKSYPWPGNIRELRNLLERSVVLASGDSIAISDLEANLHIYEISRNSTSTLPFVGEMTLDEMEEKMIRKTLEHHDFNVSNAAISLGLSRSSLYRRMEKYEIKE